MPYWGSSCVIGEAGSANAVPRLAFMPDANHKWVTPRLSCGEKDFRRSCRGNDDIVIREGNPLALIPSKKLFVHSPVRGLVLAPVGMNLSSNLGGKAVG